MDKNKFEKAQNIDRQIKFLQLRLEESQKFVVKGSTLLQMVNDRESLTIYGDSDFIKKVLGEHISSIQTDIIELQNEFDAL